MEKDEESEPGVINKGRWRSVGLSNLRRDTKWDQGVVVVKKV